MASPWIPRDILGQQMVVHVPRGLTSAMLEIKSYIVDAVLLAQEEETP